MKDFRRVFVVVRSFRDAKPTILLLCSRLWRSATWTIPVRITIAVGDTVTFARACRLEPAGRSANPGRYAPPAPGPVQGELSILNAARVSFSKRTDVMEVRLGYVFENGEITNRRALVITVRVKKSLADLKSEGVDPVPDLYAGLPVEVTGPTIPQLIAQTQGLHTHELLGEPDVTTGTCSC